MYLSHKFSYKYDMEHAMQVNFQSSVTKEIVQISRFEGNNSLVPL
jgi:hypothetical protein